jgi:hypothetical protein
MRHTIRHTGSILLAFLVTGLVLATGCTGGEQAANSDQQQLHGLITRYFTSWSKPDMAAYKGCFHPLASIYFIDGAGNPHYAQLEGFIAGQERAHQMARERLSEKPTDVSLTVHGRLAEAAVRWELHRGSAAVTGTDYFTFIKSGADWRILSLIFEEDKK